MPKQDKCFSSCRKQPKSKCTTTSRCNYTDGEKYKYCRLSRKYIMSKTKDGHCITQKRGHKRSLSEKTQSAKSTIQLAKATIQDFILKSLKKPAYKLDKAVSPIKPDKSPDKKGLAEQKIGKFILNALDRKKREKIIKAELDSRQKTIEKVRRSMFRHKIGKFMRNTTQKRRTEFLKAICSDSSVCIAFGREDTKIQNFFGGFDTFDNVVGPIKRIGTPSQNGFIHEIQYSKDGYNAFAILKSSANASGDNLFYEYMVGRYLNHLCKLVPCFVETYGLFTYDSEIDWRFAKNHAELPVQRFKNSLKVLSLYRQDILSKSCKEALLMSVLIQHIKGAETLGHKIEALETALRNPLIGKSYEEIDFVKLHLPAILFQVYNPLARFANTFTHYDLHQDNVLLYVPNADKYIHYYYHIPGGTVTEFKSHYLAKIIDYGRSYFKDTISPHSTKSSAIYKSVCQEKDCPNCGERNGYFWLKPTIDPSNYIGSQQRNASHDLRLLKTIIDMSTRLLQHNPELNDWLKNKLKFDKHYGTPEEPAGGLPARIVNVLDADMVLDAMINTPQYKIYSDIIYSDPKWSKLGDLHVYSDGRPMNFVPSTIKIS